MPSYPKIETTMMELTPCQVQFKGVDLGGTLGNVKLKVTYSKSDIKADQFGTTVLDKKVSGFNATVETELTQIKDMEQLKVIFPHATLISPVLTVTVDDTTDLITAGSPHNYIAGDTVVFSTTGTMPAPLVAGTTYYVIAAGLTATDFKVSATSGGSAVNITTTGTGTLSVEGGHIFKLEFNTQVGDSDQDNAGQLVLHPQSSNVGDVSHDWTFPIACSNADSELTYSPTEQAKMKIVWAIYPDLSVIPARFCTYGDTSI